MNTLGLWAAPLLFGLSFGLLAWVLQQALHEAFASYSEVYEEDAARQLEDVYLFIPPRRIVELAGVLAALTFVLVFMVFGHLRNLQGVATGAVAGGVAALLALQLPRWILRYLKTRRLERFNRQLVDALGGISNALKAGFSIMQAFENVVQEQQNPIAQEFSVFMHQTRVGVRFEDALRDLEQRVGSEDLSLMIRAVETARVTGGNLTDVLEKIAATIRERMRIRGRIKSLTAQGRLQGIVVGAVPLLLLIALSVLDPAMIRDFVTQPMGIALLGLVLVLEIAGALVIRRIVRIDV